MTITMKEIDWVKSLDMPSDLKQDIIEKLLDRGNGMASALVKSLEGLERKGLINKENCSILILPGKNPFNVASIIFMLNDAKILTGETIQYLKTNPGDLTRECNEIYNLAMEGHLNRTSYILHMVFGNVKEDSLRAENLASIIAILNDAEILTQETIQYLKSNPSDLTCESVVIDKLVKKGCLSRATYILLMELGGVDKLYGSDLDELLILLNKNHLLNAERVEFLRRNALNLFSLEMAVKRLDDAGILDSESWRFRAGHPKQASSKAQILVSLSEVKILDAESVINLLKEYYNCPQWRYEDFWHFLCQGVNKLHSEKLLSRQNFYFLLHHSSYAAYIAETLVLLNRANILTDHNLALLAKIPHKALDVCSDLMSSFEDNALTQEKYWEVVQRYQEYVIREQTDAGIPALYKAIAEMKHYGESLHQDGEHCKSVRILTISSRLKDKVDNFICCVEEDHFTKYSRNYRTLLADFKKDFSQVLHSEDVVLAIHRASWKPIVANILIALTGVGMFALVGQMVYSKLTTGQVHLFFHKTRSEQDRDQIDAISNRLSENNLNYVAERPPCPA